MVRLLVALVAYSQRHAVRLLLATLIATIAAGVYAAGHLQLVTDINTLFSPDLEWQKTQAEFERAFPRTPMQTVVVVEGQSVDAVDSGVAELAAALRSYPDLILTVDLPDSGPFFDKHAILFLTTSELNALSDRIVSAQPLIGPLDADPSLRGLFGVLNQAIDGLEQDSALRDSLTAPLVAVADTARSVVEGAPRVLDWGALMTGRPPRAEELRHLIVVQGALDRGAFQPGARSSALIRAIAERLHFGERGLTVRLTGEVPLSDEEFASVTQGAGLETAFSMLLVTAILWLGLRATRLILAIIITLAAGLVLTGAFAAAAVGSLTVISVAFAVLFIGIGVDFGIQFSMRFRAELYALAGNSQPRDSAAANAEALSRTARAIVKRLAIAGLSTAIGFLAFVPTDYRGVSELGFIAGAGMIVALLANLTVLPALLSLLPARGKAEAAGFGWAAPIDDRLARWAKPILVLALFAGIAAAAAIPRVRFDGDPLNLKDPHTESVRVIRELSRDPSTTPYRIEILAPDPAAAAALRTRLIELPEVQDVLTLASYIPADQAVKLDSLDQTKFLLGPMLDSQKKVAAPLLAQERQATQEFVVRLKAALQSKVATLLGEPGRALAVALDGFLAMPGGGDVRVLRQALLGGFEAREAVMRQSIAAEPVSIETLTPDIRQNWISADGLARLSVFPRGDMRDLGQLKRFVEAVRAVAPQAAGTPVDILEASATVSTAFFRASTLALVAIALCLTLVLRSARDVLIVMLPLILAALFTMATAVTIGLDFNFIDVIAIPLLMSIGVAFDIYFVLAWRAATGTALLRTSTARAVVFSAFTTAAAFGSLALSPHAGTASLGRFLIIALGYVLICTLLIQPALMTVWGRGRRGSGSQEVERLME